MNNVNVYFSSGYPIFSIDIHPNGKRFATGGQGILIVCTSYSSMKIYIKLE